jgi:hypothetical protein
LLPSHVGEYLLALTELAATLTDTHVHDCLLYPRLSHLVESLAP